MSDSAVLFVCLGNICRSPMADAVFRHLVIESGEAERILVDSAGTGSWHIGSGPHPQTQAVLVQNGIDPLASRAARQVTVADFDTFTHIVAMDSSNLADLQSLERHARNDSSKNEALATLSLLLEHGDSQIIHSVIGGESLDVPDPYYVGGYDKVYELVRTGCEGLLESII